MDWSSFSKSLSHFLCIRFIALLTREKIEGAVIPPLPRSANRIRYSDSIPTLRVTHTSRIQIRKAWLWPFTAIVQICAQDTRQDIELDQSKKKLWSVPPTQKNLSNLQPATKNSIPLHWSNQIQYYHFGWIMTLSRSALSLLKIQLITKSLFTEV